MHSLDQVRKQIDSIDQEIVSLLNTRFSLASDVAKAKKKLHFPIVDKQQENGKQKLFDQVEYNKEVEIVYQKIMWQMKQKISIELLSSHIFFIGFMATGKSTCAKRLSAMLGLDFYDLDEEISLLTGLSIDNIFSLHGEEYFREKESYVLQYRTKQKKPSIISCGGGIILREENRKWLEENGIIIYLEADSQVLYNRLCQHKKRPVLQEPTVEHIDQMKKDRAVIFNKIRKDIAINTSYLEVEAVCELINQQIVSFYQ